MKKTILSISLLLASVICFSQKDTSTQQLTDTTKFISIQDLNRYWEGYKEKVNGKQYEIFNLLFNAIINDAIKEWNDRHPPKKPKP